MKQLNRINMLLIFLLFPLLVQAKMYKWQDEKGQTHFGDRIPTKYLVKEHDIINTKGQEIEHVKSEKTADDIAKERRLLEEKRIADLEIKKQQKRDRVLMDTYTTTRDLVKTRDARLSAVDSQILLSVGIIDNVSKSNIALHKQIEVLKEANKIQPKYIVKEIKKNKRQITVQRSILKENRAKRESIENQFKDYIARFKVLNENRIKAKQKKMEAHKDLLREIEYRRRKEK